MGISARNLFFLSAFLVLFVGCSSTPYYGKIEYLETHRSNDVKIILSSVPIVVQKFQNKTSGGSSKDKASLYGTLRGGYGEHLKDLKSHDDINVDVTKTIADFLSRNGVEVVDSSSRYVFKGIINTMWVQFYSFTAHSIAIDINLIIIDNAKNETVWSGKIEKRQKGGMCGYYPEICEDESVSCFGYNCAIHGLEIYLNMVFSDELNLLWESGGLKEAIVNLQ